MRAATGLSGLGRVLVLACLGLAAGCRRAEEPEKGGVPKELKELEEVAEQVSRIRQRMEEAQGLRGRLDQAGVTYERFDVDAFGWIHLDLSAGHRIRRWMLEGHLRHGWIPLAEGRCIGHKRICLFDQIRVKEVRLRVIESVGEPIIRKLALHGRAVT